MAKGKWKKRTVPATTNNITKGVINFLLSQGHSASRINVQGQAVEGEDGRLEWRRSGSRRGFLDIGVCLLTRSGLGLFHVIDIKRGSDSLRDDQEEFIAEVKAAGGIVSPEIGLPAEYEEYYFKELKPLLDRL